MDIRSIDGVSASTAHEGEVSIWWLYKPRELKKVTDGGYLELVAEFEVKGNGELRSHQHHTHEFYYVLAGRGAMTIGLESRMIGQGDLVYIPPDTIHGLRSLGPNVPIRCVAFSIGLRDTPEVKYPPE